MSAQLGALVAAHLSDRRLSLLAWGLPLGLWSAFIVLIFPSVEGALSKAVQDYPEALKEAFGIGELTSVEQYLQAEMLSLIVPLALGYLAVRAVASGLSGAAESGRLDVLLSSPVSRFRIAAASFAATGVELAVVLVLTVILTALGSSSPVLTSRSRRRSPATPTPGRWRFSSPLSGSSPPASHCAPPSSRERLRGRW